jgi:protein involved in polysaccharide export with SLBB domain
MPNMSRFRLLPLAALALAFLLPSLSLAQDAPPLRGAAVEDSYQLGTGDKVRVAVYGEDDLGGEFQVDGNGRISMPLIGQLDARGATAPQLEEAIVEKLADGYLQNPRVSVEITTYRPFYVIGEVNKPGEYPYVNGMSALNAIALAGGYTEHANEGTIYIRRNGRTREEEVPADQMTRIFPGDVVRVHMSLFWRAMSIVSPVIGTGAFAYSASRY